jgi:hypothetical protein
MGDWPPRLALTRIVGVKRHLSPLQDPERLLTRAKRQHDGVPSCLARSGARLTVGLHTKCARWPHGDALTAWLCNSWPCGARCVI